MSEPSDVVFLAFSEAYAALGLVAVASTLGHVPPGTGCVIAQFDLSNDSIRRLERLAFARGAPLTVLAVGASLSGFPTVGRYPPITWARTLASDLLDPSVRRAVYLDADVLVRGSLAPLFSMDMTGFSLAAVADFDHPTHAERGEAFLNAVGLDPVSPYFNSGVLVIDVQRWAIAQVGNRVRDVIFEGDVPLDHVDQDALNAVVGNEWIELDSTWNAPAGEASAETRIVQFTGEVKPLASNASGPFVEEFRELAARSELG